MSTGAKTDACIRMNRCLFFLMLFVIGVSFYLLCAHTPLMMDDYDYSFSWRTGERLSGLRDILASQAAHYMLWGGRSVTHFLAQLFLYLGKPVFNAANTLMYLLLLLEICALSKGRRAFWDWRMLLVSHLILITAVEFFGVAFLWLDGACNYLWGTALALVPLLIAASERTGGFFDCSASRCCLAVPLSFFAGWTNENTACGVLAACMLLLAWDVIRKRSIRPWRIAALAAQALGVAVLLLAPGNFARAGQEASRSFVMELIYRAAVTGYCVLRYAGVPLLLLVLALFVAIKKKTRLRIEWLCVLGAAACLSAGALIGSPQISDRSFTAVIVLLICLFCAVMADINPGTGKVGMHVGAALVLACVCVGAYAFFAVKAHEAAWLVQLDRIAQAKMQGQANVSISSQESSTRYAMDIMLSPEPDVWPNSTLGKYYGIRIIGE